MRVELAFRDPSPRTIRKLVRALYQGVKKVNPTPEDYARWIRAVRGGLPLADIAQSVVDEIYPPPHRNPGVPLFAPPGHFYSPVADPKEGAEAFARASRNGWPDALPGIALDREAMMTTWAELVPLFATSGIEGSPAPGFRYGWENGHYGLGDSAVLSAMIRRFRPSKIIEIGSGWSSACMLDTLDRNPDLHCELAFIEPYPKLLYERLGHPRSNTRVLAERVQNIDPELFGALGDGDFLFIDSTHVLKSGSDVCFEIFEILPRLKRGVFVHVHDIFWPFEYPEHWIVEDNRSWNELYAYRAFLTDNPNWEIVMFNNYMDRVERDLVASTWPPFVKKSGGALWLRKR